MLNNNKSIQNIYFIVVCSLLYVTCMTEQNDLDNKNQNSNKNESGKKKNLKKVKQNIGKIVNNGIKREKLNENENTYDTEEFSDVENFIETIKKISNESLCFISFHEPILDNFVDTIYKFLKTKNLDILKQDVKETSKFIDKDDESEKLIFKISVSPLGWYNLEQNRANFTEMIEKSCKQNNIDPFKKTKIEKTYFLKRDKERDKLASKYSKDEYIEHWNNSGIQEYYEYSEEKYYRFKLVYYILNNFSKDYSKLINDSKLTKEKIKFLFKKHLPEFKKLLKKIKDYRYHQSN